MKKRSDVFLTRKSTSSLYWIIKSPEVIGTGRSLMRMELLRWKEIVRTRSP